MENSLSNLPDQSVRFDTQRLRLITSSAHLAVEQALGLPKCIGDLDDYKRWIVRFFGIYHPIELRLRTFRQWHPWEIPFDQFGHAKSLSRDLAAMHVPMQDVELASKIDTPHLSDFAEALGAVYVLEGSKLGGRFILDDLSSRLGATIEGATSFFAGHGAQTGQRWNSFKSSLDKFLLENPAQFRGVSSGAVATFTSVKNWMLPLTERSRP